MYLLFVVFNKPECLKEILRKMKEIGISGATIIDSVGAGRLRKSIGKEIPLIGSVMKALDTDIANNKTLFTLIEGKEKLDTVMDEIEKICGGDMSQPNTGIMFAVPVAAARGGSLSRIGDKTDESK
ncbi:hypothetical protein SAMN05660462_00894 [Proteiniborus ethanoligenes]|uniref:Nitrogen regulatory protein P-II family n=1 Tax=Proteiniborus ethanoligenes TaxID=415015 RepID=A0A1H3MNC6_9FIRM|nr:hypothetical protein [Proteiniborus ethanoligenes]TAH62430.1 MAG: hypothetical protein EWM50_05455 [Gottschalkiaceae bacterium]SDY78232.1 hypothetical protein SAMN05660462_00894 [Proteiniborus ethanoligenes]